MLANYDAINAENILGEAKNHAPPQDLHNLFMKAPIALCAYRGPELQIEFINPACEALFGEKNLLGKTFDEAFPELKNSENRRNHFRVYETAKPSKLKRFPVTRDFGRGKIETKHFETFLQPCLMPNGDVQGIDSYFFEMPEFEEGELLSICSHELRTPLTSLKLHADLTKKFFANGNSVTFSQDRMRKFVELSERQLDRLTRLVEEMLDFSHISSGRLKLYPENVNLEELLQNQVEKMSPQASAAQCELQINKSEPVIGEWDRFRIEQVFNNLIGNAIKYGAGHPVSIRLTQTPSAAIVHVLDKGIGIPKKNQKRIFQPYERAVSPRGISGLGLGLYISEQVIAAHGGKIRVESTPTHGSNFVVKIPKSMKPAILH